MNKIWFHYECKASELQYLEESHNPLYDRFNRMDRSDLQMLCLCSSVVEQVMTKEARMDVEPGRPQWMVQINDPFRWERVDEIYYFFSVNGSQIEHDMETTLLPS